MKKPLISVVIPTCHRNDLLAKCLECVAPGTQTLASEDYEVIVSDDGSVTTARQMIEESYPWAKWAPGPRRGPASNRNSGARHAQGEWIVFTDDDCLPVPEWLAEFARAMDGPEQALEGSIHPTEEPEGDLVECPVNTTGGYFWSANIVVKKSLFDEIGGFDENYLLAAHEDQDIHLRILEHSQVRFVPTARVFHPVRVMTFKEVLSRVPKRSKAWTYHVCKHRKKLGYDTNALYALRYARFQGRYLIRFLLQKKYKSACMAMIAIVFGIPLNLYHISKRC